MPAALVLVVTDTSMAAAAEVPTAGSTDVQAAAVSANAELPVRAVPNRSISGCAPIATRPAATLLAASTAVATVANARATATFPAKTSARVHDRVRIVAQVAYRSSDEKRSPATALARAGSSHI